MSNITVSVTCPNCGSTVVMNLTPNICGGFNATCYNCSALVCCTVNWPNDSTPMIRDVRSSGGARKR